MKIEVLGTGCAKCKKLYELVQKVVSDTGAEAEITKVEKIDEIMKYGIALTPGLVINGTVKSSGAIPKAAQLTTWIEEATREG